MILNVHRSVLYTLSGHGQSFSLIPVALPPKCQIVDVAISSSHYIALTSGLFCQILYFINVSAQQLKPKKFGDFLRFDSSFLVFNQQI